MKFPQPSSNVDPTTKTGTGEGPALEVPPETECWRPEFLPRGSHLSDGSAAIASMVLLRSQVPLADWRCSLTCFDGFFNTHPAAEADNLTFTDVATMLAPRTGPQMVVDKKKGRFVIATRLSVQPLVGRSMRRAIERKLATIGKQRSASHVTDTTLVAMEFDELTEDQARIILLSLMEAGIAFIAYSSWSHGRKPGVRMRIWFPVDRAVDKMEYRRLARTINLNLCDDLGDRSAANLSQQQGMWMAAPDTAHHAFCVIREGHPLSVAALEALEVKPAMPVQGATAWLSGPRPAFETQPTTGPVRVDLDQVTAALQLWDAENYQPWITAGMCLIALRGHAPTDALYDRWIAFCARGSARATAKNDQPAFSPSRLFVESKAVMPADRALATLFAVARDNALALLHTSLTTPVSPDCLLQAARYLSTYHPRAWAEFIRQHRPDKEVA